jgi:Flp pilus assembly protein TadD
MGILESKINFTSLFRKNRAGSKLATQQNNSMNTHPSHKAQYPAFQFTTSPNSPGLSTDEKYIAMRTTRIGYLNALIIEYGGSAPAEIADWVAVFRRRSKQPPPVLPRLWYTYVVEGIAAALASLPKDSKEIPQGDEALNKFSKAVLKRGKIDDAIAAASKNAELFPTALGPHLALGEANSVKGYKAQAAEHYRHALKLDPGNKDATAALAKMRTGRYET